MSEEFHRNDKRHTEFGERNFAEALLGANYDVRIFSKYQNVGRGAATLANKSGYDVHTAYIIGNNINVGETIPGTVIGVLIDHTNECLSVVLKAEDFDKDIWYQHEIAEAVDYWESKNSPKIYCLNEKSCGAVVFCHKDGTLKYVVIRMNSGHFGLPKGHIEKFEDEIAAAKREVSEEIGVDISIIPDFRIPVIYSISQKVTKESVYYLGEFDGGEISIQKSEVSAYHLCSYEEARQIITYDNDRTVLDAAKEKLSSVGLNS